MSTNAGPSGLALLFSTEQLSLYRHFIMECRDEGMRLIDKIDNKLKHFSSRRAEVAEVADIRNKIEVENEAIKEQLFLIGQHFWKMYTEKRYVPGDEDRQYFEAIDGHVVNVSLLARQIDERKIDGIQERNDIDNMTLERSNQRKQQAEEKRKEKERLAEERRKEKERIAEERRQERERAELEKLEREREELERRRQELEGRKDQ